jgi:hypothetical protein
MRKAANVAYQIELFDDYRDSSMKEPEEPKKMVMFPKERAVRERMRKRREAEPPQPATKQEGAQDLVPNRVSLGETA